MSVTSVDRDFDALTLTLVADHTAPVDRLWRLWLRESVGQMDALLAG